MSEIRVRVPRELREWLEQEAKRMGWTVTGVALLALWERKERTISGVTEDEQRSISGKQRSISGVSAAISGVSAAKVKFVPPDQKEAQEEIDAKGYHFTALEFVSWYATRGWRTKSGPMKDWKAAMVTWEENWKRKQGEKGSSAAVGRQQYDTSGNRELIEVIKAGKGW